jgi:hypothetical protein
MDASLTNTVEQRDVLSEALANHRCVRAIVESVLCLDESYKSFHHNHDATFPEACSCRAWVRWLGEVELHTRPYECDDHLPDSKDANDDPYKPKKARLSTEEQALVDGFFGRTSSFASPQSTALFRPDNLGKIADVLGKRKQRLTLADDSQTAPSPRSADGGDIYNGQMAAISAALRDLALQRPFACGGSVNLERPLPRVSDCEKGYKHKHLEANFRIEVLSESAAALEGGPHTVDGADQEQRWRPAGTLGKPDVDALWECATPSKFGDLRSGTDVLDEGVRRAREILPDRLRLVLPHGGSIPWAHTTLVGAVLKTALSVLQPGYPCAVRLHKLNLYGQGGFFVDHVDTPRDRAMIGTVVVGLPSSHAGGALGVTHAGASFVHQFASEGKSVASWAALYGDCPHRVEPVTAGCRLTLTFDLVHDPELKDQRYVPKYYYPKAIRTEERSAVPEESVAVMTTRLLKAVEAHCALAKPLGKRKPLGIVLSHRYVGNEPTLAGLKGVDRLVADAIGSVRRVQLLPVLVYRHLVTDKWEYDPNSEAGVVAFTPADLRYVMDPKANPRPPRIKTHTFVDMVAGRLVEERRMAGSNYTGNSASPETIGCIYFSAALLVGSPLDSPEKPAP